ncbi:MAG: Mov34/MPN/PAD-1 family protein [Tepidisphaeraceae bacterium]
MDVADATPDPAAPPTSASPPPGAPEDLDVNQVEVGSDMPVRRLEKVNGDRGTGFVVVIQRTALNAIHTHGQSDTAVEVCGVVVGELCRDRVGPYLLISDHIAGDKAASRQTQVTFTAETWNNIQAEMEAKHVGRKVVGWYHTHPGFGVFLSGMDLFIQDNFFNLPWQVAWVYDPIAETDGLFVWKSGKSVKAEFLVEENAGPHGHDFRAALPDSDRPSTIARVKRTRKQQLMNLALSILVFVATFAAIWYALSWMADHGFRIRLPIQR